MNSTRAIGAIATLGILSAGMASSQPAPAPFRIVAYADLEDVAVPDDLEESLRAVDREDAGLGLTLPPEFVRESSRLVGDVAGAWVIVRFASFNLGRESRLIIQSTEDPEQVQIFSQEELLAWDGESAVFNGNRVFIELLRSPIDDDVFYRIEDLFVGEHVGESRAMDEPADAGRRQSGAQNQRGSICSGVDERVSSADQRVGRIMPRGCTAFAIGGGVFVTAGHCIRNTARVLQFHVPTSLADGTPQSPLPQHQFPIDRSSAQAREGGVGRDWAVFRVKQGARELPHDVYGSFAVRIPGNEAVVMVRGYGKDDQPPGPDGGYNADSQTQQQDRGDLVEHTVTEWDVAKIRHRADTREGSSGAPIVAVSRLGEAIGIHTHGSEDSECGGSGNEGTSYSNGELRDAVARMAER